MEWKNIARRQAIRSSVWHSQWELNGGSRAIETMKKAEERRRTLGERMWSTYCRPIVAETSAQICHSL